MHTLSDQFVSLTNNKRVRAVALVAGGVLFAVSMGLLASSKSPGKRIEVGKVLPDAPANIPVMRYLPYPDWRVVELRAALPMAKVKPASAGTLISRR